VDCLGFWLASVPADSKNMVEGKPEFLFAA